MESNVHLCFLSGRNLTDEEVVKGTAHAVCTGVPKLCEVCGEAHVACPKCGSEKDVERERKYGLVLCIECMVDV